MTLFWLKIVAVASMLLDHSLKILPLEELLPGLGLSEGGVLLLLNAVAPLGRIAFPLFAFCIAEGCVHTRRGRSYLLRLAGFGLLSELPFRLAFGIPPLEFGLRNVFFTLLLGACACMLYGELRGRGAGPASLLPPAACALAAELLGSDYGGLGVLLIFSAYVFQEKRGRLLAMSGVLAVLYLVQLPLSVQASGWDWAACVAYWLFSLLGVGLLLFYNGRKGRGLKWGFYLFYPTHLLLLSLCSLFLTGAVI